MYRLLIIIIIISSLFIVPLSFAGQPSLKPKSLQSAMLFEMVNMVRSAIEIGLSPEYVVEGETDYTSWILASKRIIFRPDSKLIFTEDVAMSRQELFIVADEIVVEGNQNPALITWAREVKPEGKLPRRGVAPSGANGSHGSNGSPGADGAQGSTGYPGANAPTLYLFVRNITGNNILLEFSGQNGGDGGPGQMGGAGGRGGRGIPALADKLFGCKRRPGDGGNGGRGGNGGQGGTGGYGGAGGNVVVISTEKTMESVTMSIQVKINGGEGGLGGVGGRPGDGGPGGPPGDNVAPCAQIFRYADKGIDGEPGDRGTGGKTGFPGDYFASPMTIVQFMRILGEDLK